MNTPGQRAVNLPIEVASTIDKLVASGAYTPASEVVRAGLRALEQRDAHVQQWLHDEVVPVAIAMQADPSRAISANQVFAGLRTLNWKRPDRGRR